MYDDCRVFQSVRIYQPLYTAYTQPLIWNCVSVYGKFSDYVNGSTAIRIGEYRMLPVVTSCDGSVCACVVLCVVDVFVLSRRLSV
jgi:hypothetical protein